MTDDLPAEVLSFLITFHVLPSYCTMPLVFMVQVCASSIEKAQVVRAHPLMSNPGVLVGKQTYLALSPEDRLSFCHCTSQNWPEALVASHFRSISWPQWTTVQGG